eukprot:COSAG02_NODE_2944_length_7689_cov_9.378920_4_plen_90_part_00
MEKKEEQEKDGDAACMNSDLKSVTMSGREGCLAPVKRLPEGQQRHHKPDGDDDDDDDGGGGDSDGDGEPDDQAEAQRSQQVRIMVAYEQ